MSSFAGPTGPTIAMAVRRPSVPQRRDLTFKHNLELGRHGWLRLTPAYSVKVVEQVLRTETSQIAVFDPFSGSGTTALAAANAGLRALATDINPFLIWLGRVKTARYMAQHTAMAVALAKDFLATIRRPALRDPPPIHDIERWWSPRRLAFLCALRTAIDGCDTAPGVRALLHVAFCRTMIDLSNAAFNHQSMSFGDGPPPSSSLAEMRDMFLHRLDVVLSSAARNPRTRPDVRLDDARTLATIEPGAFDLLVTSPPYPNRMSYIRELRPYMYWLGHLRHATEAADLDWTAIGGTWGSATSRVGRWEAPQGPRLPARLASIVRTIQRAPARNAALLGNYVHKYFYDMHQHVDAVAARIAPGGRVHYVVGNSTFYGVLVPTETLLADLLDEAGFTHVSIERLRKRNSKRELFEFDVSATRPHRDENRD